MYDYTFRLDHIDRDPPRADPPAGICPRCGSVLRAHRWHDLSIGEDIHELACTAPFCPYRVDLPSAN